MKQRIITVTPETIIVEEYDLEVITTPILGFKLYSIRINKIVYKGEEVIHSSHFLIAVVLSNPSPSLLLRLFNNEFEMKTVLPEVKHFNSSLVS